MPKSTTTTDEIPADRIALKASEVRRMLGISPNTLERLIAQGVIPVVRIGRIRRFRREDIEALVRSNNVGGDAE